MRALQDTRWKPSRAPAREPNINVVLYCVEGNTRPIPRQFSARKHLASICFVAVSFDMIYFLIPRSCQSGKIATLPAILRSKENQSVRPMIPLPNYLKMHRIKAGYSQKELGEILEGLDGSEISRYEKGTRQPGLTIVASLEIIFGVSRHELFPRLAEVDPGQIQRRVTGLLNKEAKKPTTPFIERKILSLKTILARLDLLATTRINDGRPI